jgi:hypothetical protein
MIFSHFLTRAEPELIDYQTPKAKIKEEPKVTLQNGKSLIIKRILSVLLSNEASSMNGLC